MVCWASVKGIIFQFVELDFERKVRKNVGPHKALRRTLSALLGRLEQHFVHR